MVSYGPDSDNDVKLVFADGELTGYIKARTLVQARATDAGYDALAPMVQGIELCDAAGEGRHEDVSRLIAEGASPDANGGDGKHGWLSFPYGLAPDARI